MFYAGKRYRNNKFAIPFVILQHHKYLYMAFALYSFLSVKVEENSTVHTNRAVKSKNLGEYFINE